MIQSNESNGLYLNIKEMMIQKNQLNAELFLLILFVITAVFSLAMMCILNNTLIC